MSEAKKLSKLIDEKPTIDDFSGDQDAMDLALECREKAKEMALLLEADKWEAWTDKDGVTSFRKEQESRWKKMIKSHFTTEAPFEKLWDMF